MAELSTRGHSHYAKDVAGTMLVESNRIRRSTQQHVLPAFPQGRHIKSQYVDSIVEIRTESAFQDFISRITIRGCQ